VREVVVDLPPHALHLRRHRRGELQVARGGGAVGVARQHGQRRLEAVRQVAGLGQRALHARFALREQRVEIVHERLDFRWIEAAKLAVLAAVHRVQPRVEQGHRPEAAADLPGARHHGRAAERQDDDHVDARENPVDQHVRLRIGAQQVDQKHADHEEQAQRP